jgi:hypothetical protein
MADRNAPQKLVWRSAIVLLSAAHVGTMSIAHHRPAGELFGEFDTSSRSAVANDVALWIRFNARPTEPPAKFGSRSMAC